MLEGVERIGGGTRGDGVINMTGDAVVVDCHKFYVALLTSGDVAYECEDFFLCFDHRLVAETAVVVTEMMCVGRADKFCCRMPLGEPYCAKVKVVFAVDASGAVGQGDEVDFCAALGFEDERAAWSEGFIVGVCEDSEQQLFHKFSILREQ